MIDAYDLRAGLLTNLDQRAHCPVDVVLIRASMAAFPGGLFYPAADIGPRIDIGPTEAFLSIGSMTFEHVIGRTAAGRPWGYPPLDAASVMPSESATYRTLAEARASRDVNRFRPGLSNLDWRPWARFVDRGAP